MERYNPSQTPDPNQWQVISEFERITLVEEFRARNTEAVPSGAERVHAAIHVMAMGVEPVAATIAKLIRQGLDKHGAIRAVGAVLAEDMFAITRGEQQTWNEAHYRKRLEKLTAKRWKKGNW